jgi:CubicO group peptidase (beta-lactamase class C family)
MRRIDHVIDRAISEQRIVGAVVLVSRRGKLIYRASAGLADRENGIRMTTGHVFRLASVSKLVTAVATMRLLGAGTLSLSDPITKWLPDFRPRTTSGDAPPISIHHLLAHTAGLSYSFSEPPDSPYHALGISDGLDRVQFDLDENLRRLALAPLVFAPGTGWRYSLSIDVLGAIVSRILGCGLPEAIRAIVCAPLGLETLGFSPSAGSELAVPYVSMVGTEPHQMADPEIVISPETPSETIRFSPGRVFDSTAFPSAGAGMVGTADDVFAILQLLQHGGGYLTTDLVRWLLAAQVSAHAETQGPGWGFGYAGGVLLDRQLARTPQRNGCIQWGGVYGHYWFYDPSQDLCLLSLTNTTWEGAGGSFTTELRDAAYAESGVA